MSWVSYTNGNYKVYFERETGTKIRKNDLDYLDADFPECIDLKLTNKCHNQCKFCHENSSCDGKHANILNTSVIDTLHPYTELSLGGGNPLEHPDLIAFLEKLKTCFIFASMTIRQNDFMDNLDLLRDLRDKHLIYGLGISLVNPTDEFIKAAQEFPNAVIHVINGIVTMPQLDMLAKNGLKLLILGYKEVRRGKDLYESSSEQKERIDALKQDVYNYLPEIIEQHWFDVVSFDNLAIKQLNPQRLVSKEQWEQMYMGDDGIDGEQTSASMYIDLVEGKYARNSCDVEHRFDMGNLTAEQMYQHLKNLK